MAQVFTAQQIASIELLVGRAVSPLATAINNGLAPSAEIDSLPPSYGDGLSYDEAGLAAALDALRSSLNSVMDDIIAGLPGLGEPLPDLGLDLYDDGDFEDPPEPPLLHPYMVDFLYDLYQNIVASGLVTDVDYSEDSRVFSKSRLTLADQSEKVSDDEILRLTADEDYEVFTAVLDCD